MSDAGFQSFKLFPFLVVGDELLHYLSRNHRQLVTAMSKNKSNKSKYSASIINSVLIYMVYKRA
jgi:hypothetical protein